jgi:hypothetical protein
MLPWDHLWFGYLLYSLSVHARTRGAPGSTEALWLAFGTQFPDLVDKPLAWGLDVLPSGVFVHAIPVAIPLACVGIFLAWVRGRAEVGVAFAVGYLSHVAGDVLYPVMHGGRPAVGGFLWPFVSYPTGVDRGFLENVWRYLDRYVHHLSSPEGLLFVALELLLASLAIAVWLWDGRPGAAVVRSGARTAGRRVMRAIRPGSSR